MDICVLKFSPLWENNSSEQREHLPWEEDPETRGYVEGFDKKGKKGVDKSIEKW